jgi:putative nucleotidyltransferase with HDIG domain
MLYRVKQFFKGVTAPEPDTGLIDIYLNQDEAKLFMKLPRYEKRHAVDTAMTIRKFHCVANEDILVKAALLHDIGKVGSGVGLIKKSILVLMNRVFPSASHRLAGKLKMFHIYYNHHAIGAEMLRRINTCEHVVLLVEHHQSWDDFHVEGIEFLKKADGLN